MSSVLNNYFTEEELATFSPEELEKLELAFGYVELAKKLPTDENFMKKMKSTFEGSGTLEEADKRLIDVAKQDPKFFEEIMAATTLAITDQEEEPATTVQKVDASEIKQQQKADKKAEMKNDILAIVKCLMSHSVDDIREGK